MALRYALYPGCAAKGATPELYQSTMAIIGRLDIQIVELAAASCCGAGVVTEGRPGHRPGTQRADICAGGATGAGYHDDLRDMSGIMSAANKRLKTEPGLLKRINEVLAQDGLAYGGTIQVKHLLWIVVREVGLPTLQTQVRIPLHDLRIAPFYGCYTSSIMGSGLR